MSLCVSGAGAMVAVGWTVFTLSWTHTVEKIRWEEDWRVSMTGLHLIEARVKGTGAGMEPAADAELHDGWWHYRPKIEALPRLVLARYDGAGDWRLCGNEDDCSTTGELLGVDADAITLERCP